MDSFEEQLLKRKRTIKDWLLIALVCVLAVALIIICVNIYVIALFGLIGAVFAVVLIIRMTSVEFEYTITNGDIDIDRIIGQRSRKRIVSVRGNKLEQLAPYKPDSLAGKSFQRKVMAASSAKAEGLWYFTYTSKKSGNTAVIFEPNNRILNEMYRGLPTNLKNEVRRTYSLGELPDGRRED